MDAIAARAIAVTQCIEAMARLMLSMSRLVDPEKIECITLKLNCLAYDAEHACTYKDKD